MILQLISSLLVSCSVGAPLGSTTLPIVEPSSFIHDDTSQNDWGLTLHQGNAYRFTHTIVIGTSSFQFNLLNDLEINAIRLSNFYCNHTYQIDYYNVDFDYLDFDYVDVAISLEALRVNETTSLVYCDTAIDDYGFSFSIVGPLAEDTEITYSFDMVVLQDFLTDSDFANYITPIVNPYAPPSKSNLYRLLYDFYYSIFNDDDLTAISTSFNMPFDNWLAHTCTIITLLTLVVVAFFFLRWLFKVISGLILLKR